MVERYPYPLGARGWTAWTYDVLLKGRSEHAWNRDYLQLVKSALIDGIKDARSRLAPARVAIGTGMARANINRRARDLDGTISLGYNPDGPVDRQIGLVRLERTDGSVIAMIANYAIHGTALGGQFMEVSGDAPGVVSSYIEEKLGGITLFVNGAAGNIAPIYTVQPNPKSAHLGEFRVLLGNRILDANIAMGSGGAAPKLWLGEKWIETPRKPDLGWSDELSAYASKTAVGWTWYVCRFVSSV